MSLRRPRFQEENAAESINISPLIDVIFILLIFFIVTMAFSDGSAIRVDVPKASSARKVESKPLTVVIHSDSSITVRGRKLTMSELEYILREHTRSNTSVILRGDGAASIRTLVAVMDCAKACGAKEIYVSAEKK